MSAGIRGFLGRFPFQLQLSRFDNSHYARTSEPVSALISGGFRGVGTFAVRRSWLKARSEIECSGDGSVPVAGGVDVTFKGELRGVVVEDRLHIVRGNSGFDG